MCGGGVLQLSHREARPHPQTGAPHLNFGGRVKFGSVKNFQMELGPPSADTSRPDLQSLPPGTVLGGDGERPLLLQFGKAGSDTFILDFRHPLSPVQAFALGLTALVRKLSSEGG